MWEVWYVQYTTDDGRFARPGESISGPDARATAELRALEFNRREMCRIADDPPSGPTRVTAVAVRWG